MEIYRFNCRTDDKTAWKCSADIINKSSDIKKEYKTFNTPEYTGLRDKIAEYISKNQDKLLPGNNTVDIPASILGDALQSKAKQDSNKNKQPLNTQANKKAAIQGKHPIQYMGTVQKRYPEEASEFTSELLSFCNKHRIEPNTLMKLMAVETGGKFDTTTQNEDGYAFGLIQFTRQAANDIGVPWETIKSASLVEQFQYAEKYLEKQARNQGVNLADLNLENLYLLILYPKGIKSPPDADAIVIPATDVRSYNSNISINEKDGDNDGFIERGDIRARIAKW